MQYDRQMASPCGHAHVLVSGFKMWAMKGPSCYTTNMEWVNFHIPSMRMKPVLRTSGFAVGPFPAIKSPRVSSLFTAHNKVPQVTFKMST